jgi:hypothetical protein
MKSPVRVIGGRRGGGGGVRLHGRRDFQDNARRSCPQQDDPSSYSLCSSPPFSLSILIDFLALLLRVTNLTTVSFTLNSVCWRIHVLHMIHLP